MRRRARWLAVAAALACGCGGNTGTIGISLVSAPDSDLLARTQRVRLELSNPPAVAEAERSPGGGLALDLEVAADGSLGTLSLEAFDAGGESIGVASSAVVPIAAIDGVVTLYVAPPMSIGEAPVSLDPARDEMAVTQLGFGAGFAGGRDAAGDVTGDMVIYNVYDHDFQIGLDLPAPRAGAAAMTTSGARIFVFSGVDAAGDPLADLLLFDTRVAPAGDYLELDAPAELARSGAAAAALGNEQFAVLGDPPVHIDGQTGVVSALSDTPLAGTLTTTTLGGLELAVAIGSGTGDSGGARLSAQAVTELEAPAEALRTDHGAAALPGGDVLAVGGTDAGGTTLGSALRYRVNRGDFEVLADFLATPRSRAAVAATERYLVVAGGLDAAGDLVGDAEIFNAQSLAPVAVLPLVVPRSGADAVPLSNGQVLIVGGRDAAGDPIGVMELFTPDLE